VSDGAARKAATATSLREQAASGVRWTSVTTFTTVVLGVVQMAILTRLLDHADFGLMTMVTAVVGFANIWADLGFSNAIVYRQDATGDQLSTLYWFNLVAGVVVLLLALAVAPLVVAYYDEPRVQGPYLWACLSFVIIPVGQQFQMLLQKNLRFRRLGGIEIVAAIVGLGVSVGSALAGAGVYALVWGQLANLACRASLLAATGWRRWRPRFHVARDDLRGFVRFGLYQMGERSVYYFTANIDYLLIGRYLGADKLGVYTIAYTLVVQPLLRIRTVLTRVAFPIFARRQHDDSALRRGFCELIELVGVATFPLYLGLAALAPLAVPVIFGSQWGAAAVLVQAMVVMGMCKSLSNPASSVFLSKGRADVGFWENVAAAVVTFVTLRSLVGHGTLAVAWGQSAVNLVFFVVEFYLLRYVIGLGWVAYLKRLGRPLATSLAMGAVVWATYAGLRGSFTHGTPLLLILVAEGVLVYALLWTAIDRSYVGRTWRLMLGRPEVSP